MFTLAFENLFRCCIAFRVSLIRLIFVELTRVFNGLLACACMVFDIGCMSPLIWSFEERDKIMTFFDFTCGCRMHLAYFCICGVFDDFSFALIDFIVFLCYSSLFLIDLYDIFCFINRICYLRLRGISLLCI
jgi:NADH-quinone oxidoreductase subunit D